MTHTPAPWIAHGWGDDEVEIVGPDDRLICELAQEYDDHSGAGTNAAIVADARLISAAPDLLAALRSIVEASQWEGEVAWLEQLWPTVNAALTKAEGGDAWDASMGGQTSG